MNRVVSKIKKNKFYKKIKNDSFWNALFKNSFWAFFGDTIASVFGFITTIILINLIGNESLGLLILAESYMNIIDTILNIQSWKSVIQYGQKSLVSKKIDLFKGYIKLGTILDVSTAILGGIVAIFIAPFMGKIFNFSQELIICFQIFSICIFSHFSGTPTAILRLYNKFNLVAFQKAVTAFAKVIILTVLLVFYKDINLIKTVIIYCSVDILGNLLLVFFAFYVYHKKVSKVNIFKNKLPDDSKSFIIFTIWGTLGEVVDVPVNYFDMFIISLLGKEYVAVFKVFKQCSAILNKVTSPIQQSILPQFSELTAKGNLVRGYEVVLKIRNAILKIVGPISLIMGVTSPIWLNIFFGGLYAENWYVFTLYLIIQTFALSYTTIHPYFLSLNKAKESTIYILFSNAIYVLISLLLVQKIGMIGIVIAFGIQCFLAISLKAHNIKSCMKG